MNNDPLIDKLVKLNEIFSQYQYYPTKEKDELMMDFFLIAALPTPNDENLAFALRDVRKDFYPWMRKEMLKAVKFCICCEFRHIFDNNYGGTIAEWAKEKNPETLSFLKKYTTYFYALKSTTGHKNISRTLIDVDNIRRDFKEEEAMRKVSYRAMKQSGVDEKLFVETARDAFIQLGWSSSYGGQPWSNICVAWLKLYEAQIDRDIITYVDHMYDLQHNTSTVFNKLTSYVKSGGYSWLQHALDYKYNTDSLYDLFPLVSSDLKNFAAAVIKDATGDNLEDWLKRGGSLDTYKDYHQSFSYKDAVEYTGPRSDLHGKIGKIKGEEKGAYTVEFEGGLKAHGILPKYLTKSSKTIKTQSGSETPVIEGNIEVGDTIEIINTASYGYTQIGSQGIVKKVSGDYVYAFWTKLTGSYGKNHENQKHTETWSIEIKDVKIIKKANGQNPQDKGKSVLDKFNNSIYVGDEVTYVSPQKKIGITKGKKYEVVKIRGFLVYIVNNKGKTVGLYGHRFEKVSKEPGKQYKFKVGDKVKVVQSGLGIAHDDLGKTTIITAVGGTYGTKFNPLPAVKTKDFDNKGHDDWIAEVSFELVSSAEKKEQPNKFNVGDEVKIKAKDSDGSKAYNGIIGKITKINLDYVGGPYGKGMPYYILNIDSSKGIWEDELELVNANNSSIVDVDGHVLKVGDTVEVTTNGWGVGPQQIGKKFKLVKINDVGKSGPSGILEDEEGRYIGSTILSQSVKFVQPETIIADISSLQPLDDHNPKVEVGDKIVCLNNGGYLKVLTVGKVYTIKKIGGTQVWVSKWDDGTESTGVFIHRFAKYDPSNTVNKQEFKVGDEIKIVKEVHVASIGWSTSMDKYIGKTAKITRVEKNHIHIDIDSGSWAWPFESIEKITNVDDVKEKVIDSVPGFAKGDHVKVINDGKVYSSYYLMAKILGLTKWTDGNSASNGDMGTIIAFGKHANPGYTDPVVALKLDDGREVLVGMNGIEKVSESETVDKPLKDNQDVRPGDKVKCINNDNYMGKLTLGKIYTILKLDSSDMVVVKWDNGKEGAVYAWRFTKVTEGSFEKSPTKGFSIGDKIKVKLLGDFQWTPDHAGETGEVIDIDDVSVQVDLEKEKGVWFKFDEVEYISKSDSIEKPEQLKVGDKVKYIGPSINIKKDVVYVITELYSEESAKVSDLAGNLLNDIMPKIKNLQKVGSDEGQKQTDSFAVGAKVKLKKTSKFYSQAPEEIGKITGLSSDGWVDVTWDGGYSNAYKPNIDIELVGEELKPNGIPFPTADDGGKLKIGDMVETPDGEKKLTGVLPKEDHYTLVFDGGYEWDYFGPKEGNKKFNKGDQVAYTGTNPKISKDEEYTFVAYLKGKKQVKIKNAAGKIFYPFEDNLEKIPTPEEIEKEIDPIEAQDAKIFAETAKEDEKGQELKAGDTVECIEGKEGFVTTGNKYEVLAVYRDNGTEYLQIAKDDTGTIGNYKAKRFKKVDASIKPDEVVTMKPVDKKQPKFKVGDKVKVVHAGSGIHPDDLWKTTTITAYSPTEGVFGSGYKFDTTGFKHADIYNGGWAEEKSFELLNKDTATLVPVKDDEPVAEKASVGDWVKCINADGLAGFITVGQKYQVKGVSGKAYLIKGSTGTDYAAQNRFKKTTPPDEENIHEIKPGDIVECIEEAPKVLTLGKKYKVLDTFGGIKVVNDLEVEVTYKKSRFKKVQGE